jgi:hypothetical protein
MPMAHLAITQNKARHFFKTPKSGMNKNVHSKFNLLTIQRDGDLAITAV